MNNHNLRKALEANQFYYAGMYEAMRPPHEKIRLGQKQVLTDIYREMTEIEMRLQAMEGEFGYKYSPNAHKFNPYHDDLGRFTFGPGGGGGSNQDGAGNFTLVPSVGGDNNRDGSGIFTFGPDAGSESNQDDNTGAMVPGAGTVMDDSGKLYPADPLSKPDGIFDDWMTRPSLDNKGVRYTDPTNMGNEVRIMQGDPNSKWPNSQKPYVRWMNNGQWLDVNGNATTSLEEAHIPLEDFEFMPEIFLP